MQVFGKEVEELMTPNLSSRLYEAHWQVSPGTLEVVWGINKVVVPFAASRGSFVKGSVSPIQSRLQTQMKFRLSLHPAVHPTATEQMRRRTTNGTLKCRVLGKWVE